MNLCIKNEKKNEHHLEKMLIKLLRVEDVSKKDPTKISPVALAFNENCTKSLNLLIEKDYLKGTQTPDSNNISLCGYYYKFLFKTISEKEVELRDNFIKKNNKDKKITEKEAKLRGNDIKKKKEKGNIYLGYNPTDDDKYAI